MANMQHGGEKLCPVSSLCGGVPWVEVCLVSWCAGCDDVPCVVCHGLRCVLCDGVLGVMTFLVWWCDLG